MAQNEEPVVDTAVETTKEENKTPSIDRDNDVPVKQEPCDIYNLEIPNKAEDNTATQNKSEPPQDNKLDPNKPDESTDTKEIEQDNKELQQQLEHADDETETKRPELHVELDVEFDFSEWITQNGLQSVHALLSKHKATSLSTLNISCKEFQSFMTDPELFSKAAHMIPKILMAVHSISSLIKVIVSEHEQEVIDNMQENIKSLNDTAKLQPEFAKSVQKIQEQKIKKKNDTKIKINQIFDDLITSVNTARQSALNELDGIEDEKNEEGNDAVAELTQHITNSKKFLTEKTEIYNKLTSNNENRSDRKSKIIKMGKDVDCQFSETQKILNKFINIITHEIDKNNKVIVDIDFVVKPNRYAKIIKYITKFSTVINKRYESVESKNNENNRAGNESEDEEVIIKRLKNQTKKQSNQYKQIQSELENIERELQEKNKEYEALQKQLQNEKQKYVNICDEKQQMIKDLETKNNQYVQVCKELQQEKIKCGQVSNAKQQIIKEYEKLEKALKQEKSDRVQEINEKEQIKQKMERDLAIKNQECQSFQKAFQQGKTKYFNEFNAKQRIIKELKENSQKYQEIQKLLAQEKTKVMQLNNFIQKLSNNEQKIFLTLTKNLTLSPNDKYRWFKCEECDEKKDETNAFILECVMIIQENPIWVKLIKNGEIKKNVSPNMLFLAPKIDNNSMHYIGEYHERLFKLNAFKLETIEYSDWQVVSASHEIEKAKILSSKQRTNAFWSGCNDFPQWFIIDTNVPTLIRSVELKNYHDDEDTIKDCRLQVSNQLHGYDDDDNDGWIDVQSFSSHKTAEWQVFNVSINENVRKSRYWRFYVENSYGGYARLDYLKLKFVV